MNMNNAIGRVFVLTVVLLACGCGSALGVGPQTLVNFQVSPGTVTGNLVEGPDGNLYGTTTHAGPLGKGTIFRVTPSGTLTTIVSDQENPSAGLIVGNDGLLYGMTGAGGAFGWGTAFRMTTNAALTTFAVLDGTNGGNPQFGLVLAGDGNFYGASQEGGANSFGAVFRITTNGAFSTLFLFQGPNGSNPAASLVLGPDGNLYGTTAQGGPGGGGTIFRVVLAPQFSGIASLPDRRLVLAVTAPPGAPFHLWTSPDLAAPVQSWTVLANGTFDADGTLSYTDSPPAAVQGYYRLSVP